MLGSETGNDGCPDERIDDERTKHGNVGCMEAMVLKSQEPTSIGSSA